MPHISKHLALWGISNILKDCYRVIDFDIKENREFYEENNIKDSFHTKREKRLNPKKNVL
ncbi:MAG: hypothetical protein ACP6IY_20870 [Promethearchaeia archaeon]